MRKAEDFKNESASSDWCVFGFMGCYDFSLLTRKKWFFDTSTVAQFVA